VRAGFVSQCQKKRGGDRNKIVALEARVGRNQKKEETSQERQPNSKMVKRRLKRGTLLQRRGVNCKKTVDEGGR